MLYFIMIIGFYYMCTDLCSVMLQVFSRLCHSLEGPTVDEQCSVG